MIQIGIDIVPPAVLEVKIIGVFPDVNGQQRFYTACDGSVGIGCLYNLKILVSAWLGPPLIVG